MFNNVVLDVVIGLVFIYLLYSLLITVAGEFVAAKLGIRSRMLRFAIERMLNDGYYNQSQKKKVNQSAGKKMQEAVGGAFSTWWKNTRDKFLLVEREEFSKSFAGKFYAYSSIKYLGKVEKKNGGMFSQTKPSYFSSDTFADTIVNILQEKGVGTTEEEKVDFCLTFNTHHIQPETLRHFQNLWGNSNQNILLFKDKLKKWFSETMDRSNGWYKQKMQLVSLLLGFLLVASFNIDSIRIARILAKDKAAREQLVTLSVQFLKDSAQYHDYVVHTTDSVKKVSPDSVYQLLKKDMDAASTILAFGWDFTALRKEHHTSVSKKESPEVFEVIAGNIEPFAKVRKQQGQLINRIRKNKIDQIDKVAELQKLFIDTLILYNEWQLAESDSLRKKIVVRQKAARKAIVKNHARTAELKKKIVSDSVSYVYTTRTVDYVRKSINRQLNLSYTTIDSAHYADAKTMDVITIRGKVPVDVFDKAGHFIIGIYDNFFGLILTAIALSFGAPFWFDMLKKVISLRAAGVKPEEKAPPAEEPKPPVLPVVLPVQGAVAVRKGKDTAEDWLLTEGPKIRAIAGVKSLFIFKDPQTKNKEISINVADATVASIVNQQLSLMTTTGLNIVLQITGMPHTHQGPGMIHVKESDNGEGSLGCVLRRKDTGSLHILSCWHVMKDLSLPETSGSIIADHVKQDLAERWAGGIRDAFDYGIARCKSGASIKSNDILMNALKITKGRISFRAVTQQDLDNQIGIAFLDFLTGVPVKKTGVLFTDSTEVEIEYADKTRTIKDVLVLTQSLTTRSSISQPGNSGSIVFDSNNKAIGMIIGGDSTFTYAVRLSHIMSIHKEMSIA